MANLSIKSKLLVMLLAVSLFSIAVVASLNYYTCYQTLKSAIFSHLTSVRASRADQIEQNFARLRMETIALARGNAAIDASRQFIDAYRKLEDAQVEPEMDAALRQFYQQTFAPELEKDDRIDRRDRFAAAGDCCRTLSAVSLHRQESVSDRRKGRHAARRRRVRLQPRARDVPSDVAAPDPDLRFRRYLSHRHRDRRDRLHGRQAPRFRDSALRRTLRAHESRGSVPARAARPRSQHRGGRGFPALSADHSMHRAHSSARRCSTADARSPCSCCGCLRMGSTAS